jgi:hypothetical protein
MAGFWARPAGLSPILLNKQKSPIPKYKALPEPAVFRPGPALIFKLYALISSAPNNVTFAKVEFALLSYQVLLRGFPKFAIANQVVCQWSMYNFIKMNFGYVLFLCALVPTNCDMAVQVQLDCPKGWIVSRLYGYFNGKNSEEYFATCMECRALLGVNHVFRLVESCLFHTYDISEILQPGAYPSKSYKYWFTNICNFHIIYFCYF